METKTTASYESSAPNDTGSQPLPAGLPTTATETDYTETVAVQLVDNGNQPTAEATSLVAIPEPSSALLLGLCGAALILFRRK